MIEPELEQPTPRRIRRRAGRGFFIGCTHIFVLPHMTVGVVVFFVAVWLVLTSILLALFGTDVAGEVTQTHQGRSKSGPTYEVRYTFRIDETSYEASSSVNAAEFAALLEGTVVAVRVIPFLPHARPQLVAAGTNGHWAETGGLVFFATFWNGIMSVALWSLYIAPWRLRGLVRHGTPTLGRITDKNIQHGKKQTTYVVNYEYEVPRQDDEGLATDAIETLQGKMNVRSQDYGLISILDQATVLYDPKRPGRSVLYPYGDYGAVGE
jgi:hypothetical protein